MIVIELVRWAFARAINRELMEVEQLGVGHLGWGNVLHRCENGLDATGVLTLPLLEHGLDILSLQVFLRTTKIARDDWELHQGCKLLQIPFPAESEGTNNHITAIVGTQLWWHGREA